MSSRIHHQLVVIGGGAAGLGVAARMLRVAQCNDVAIIDPSEHHFYQPLWTLVGGGVMAREASRKPMVELIPAGAKWIRDAVIEFRPEQNLLRTRDGLEVEYEYLVVAPGLQIDWDKIDGLPEALGKNGVCSNYSYDTVESTWQNIRGFTGGNAIFTFPPPPIKCAGAPQKIMYLAEDYFRKQGLRDKSNVIYYCATPSIFSAPHYAEALNRQVVGPRNIDVRYKHNLVAIRGEAKEAVFRNTESGEEVVQSYDMIHVVPPMSAPDFVKQSPLANEAGWVDVNKETLQHSRFSNVFGIGDASSLPTSKTAAAVRAQAPVLEANLSAVMRGQQPEARYDGYTSCPLVTGYGKLILAEFDYDLKPCETFPFDQSKERWSMYQLKRYVLPVIYWKGLLRGYQWPRPGA